MLNVTNMGRREYCTIFSNYLKKILQTYFFLKFLASIFMDGVIVLSAFSFLYYQDDGMV